MATNNPPQTLLRQRIDMIFFRKDHDVRELFPYVGDLELVNRDQYVVGMIPYRLFCLLLDCGADRGNKAIPISSDVQTFARYFGNSNPGMQPVILTRDDVRYRG